MWKIKQNICKNIKCISHCCFGLHVGITHTWKCNLNNLPVQNARIDFKHLPSLLSWRGNKNPTTEPLGEPDTSFADKMSNSGMTWTLMEFMDLCPRIWILKKGEMQGPLSKYFKKSHTISAKLYKNALSSISHWVWGCTPVTCRAPGTAPAKRPSSEHPPYASNSASSYCILPITI